MNYYLISKSSDSLFADDNLVQAENSKEALEKFIGKKVKRVIHNEAFDYSVYLSNEKGQYYTDRRTHLYYNVIDNKIKIPIIGEIKDKKIIYY